MSKKQSRTFEITQEVTNYATVGSTSLMPISGDIYIWYGDFTGDAAALAATGMPIPQGALLEPYKSHDGIIHMRSVVGTVVMHEVV